MHLPLGVAVKAMGLDKDAVSIKITHYAKRRASYMKVNVKIIAGLFVIICNQSFADQCAWVNGQAALRFEELVASGKILDKYFVEYCHLCENSEVTTPEKVRKVLKEKVDKDYFQFSFLDDKNQKVDLDLAYTFIETKDGIYKNLGILTNCIEDLDAIEELR